MALLTEKSPHLCIYHQFVQIEVSVEGMQT